MIEIATFLYETYLSKANVKTNWIGCTIMENGNIAKNGVLPLLFFCGKFDLSIKASLRYRLVFLLQNLGLPKIVKKPVLPLWQKVDFLGVIVHSKEKTLSHPQEKVLVIMKQCYIFLTKNQVSVREIS